MSRTLLQKELAHLLVGTNEQRRCFGQTIYHFYRTLLFWGERGATFTEATRKWAPAGAEIFAAMARRLRDLQPHEEDPALRTFAREVVLQLARDLERGEHMRISFLRTLEQRFPLLTRMMREEDDGQPLYDYHLAYEMSYGLAAAARVADVVGALDGLAEALMPGASSDAP